VKLSDVRKNFLEPFELSEKKKKKALDAETMESKPFGTYN
jgi:hypothetical protein